MNFLPHSLLLVARKVSDIIFPPSEDELQLRQVDRASFVRRCHPTQTKDWVALSSFSDPVVRAAIHLNKFHHHAKARGLLAALLARWCQAQNKSYVIVPIPLAAGRQRQRGYNQVAAVIASLDLSTQQRTVAPELLVRIRETKAQTTLQRSARLTNMRDAFAVTAHGKDISDKHILLVDDVVTTGATLEAAKAALSPLSPASITCLAFAH